MEGDLAENIKKFPASLHKEIALLLIRGKATNFVPGSAYVINRLHDFEGLDHNEIVTELLKKGQAKEVQRNIKKFKGLSERMILEVNRMAA